MRIILLAISLFITVNCFSQIPVPVKDSTRWTEFRDDYYNPNIDTIKAKLDSIYNAFQFKIDSTIAIKMMVLDSFKFANDTTVLKGTYPINNVVWDTIYFQNGTKQSTAYTP